MSFNWEIIHEKLYGILRGFSKEVVMYDEKGNRTIDPAEGTRFFVTFNSADKKLESFLILVAMHNDGQDSVINIKTPELKSDKDFEIVHSVRDHIRNAIGRREGIKVDWQIFDHEIDPREEAVNNIKESKDVSKVFGTTKSSFQRIGEAKLIIRHTETVNEEKHGARSRHIRALFIENKQGERFAYPHLHVSGARAFARHVSNGGTNHDNIAETIFEMSNDYINLRNSGRLLRKNKAIHEWVNTIRENMHGINRKLKSLHGPKGYSTISPTLTMENVITDNNAIQELHAKLAEMCNCQSDNPMYESLGRAAYYISTHPIKEELSFGWKNQPSLTPPDGMYENVLDKLHWQLQELATACSIDISAAKLSEIANKIKSKAKIEEDELNFIREAFTSSLSYVPEDTRLPEEKELDEFLSEFDDAPVITTEDVLDVEEDFVLDLEENSDMEKCPNCKGDGDVKALNGGKKACPVCNGRGEVKSKIDEANDDALNDDNVSDDSLNDDRQNDDSQNDDMEESVEEGEDPDIMRLLSLAGI